jgi:electron transport complex protein RnfC
MPTPKKVYVSMSQHIGAPATPIVNVGDVVNKRQLIGQANGVVSANVYSSSCGTVTAIEDIVSGNGQKATYVVIENDGREEEIFFPPIEDYEPKTIIERVRLAGIVGLGGAGFPTYAKFATDKKIEYLVVNGAECEPYITSDTRTVIEEGDILVASLERILSVCGIGRAVIGIEKDNKEAIAAISSLISDKDNISLQVLSTRYPQGAEKILIYNTTGLVVPEGGLPADVGCVVMNVTSLAFLAKYIETGMPLVEKCITVDGSALKNPMNVIAPIGTPIQDVIDFTGGYSEEPGKILYGGPMMGIAVTDISSPILKQTNAVIFMGEKEATPPPVTPCIKCGACMNTCPLSLDPISISKAFKLDDAPMLEKLKVDICMECGCCSYVCPAKRNIVQRNKMAKTMLRNYQIEKKKREEAQKNG